MRDCLMLDIFSIAMYIVGVLLHTYMYTVPRQLTRQNERQTVTSRLPAQDNFPPHTTSTVPCHIATLGTTIQCYMLVQKHKSV